VTSSVAHAARELTMTSSILARPNGCCNARATVKLQRRRVVTSSSSWRNRRISTRALSSKDDDDVDEEERKKLRPASRATMEALRARARVDGPPKRVPVALERSFGASSSSVAVSEDEEKGEFLDAFRKGWDVPWGGATVALGLAGWCVSFVGVAAIVFPLLAAQAGVDPAKMSLTEQTEYLLAVQVAETVTSLGLVYTLVSPHMETIKEEGKDWFKIDFREPFESERGWAKYGLIGYGATFAALAVTGLAMDAAEKAQGGQMAVDAASDQVGTIDGVLPLIQSDDIGTFLALLSVTSVLAPLLEEVVFRGFLLASLTKWLPTPGAVLFSSVLFAGAHLAPRDFVELVVLGMVLGFSYARTRNLLTPMLIHSMWNSGVLLVVAAAIQGGFAKELGIPGV